MNVFIRHTSTEGARSSSLGQDTEQGIAEATGEEPAARPGPQGTSFWAGQRAAPETENWAGQSQVPGGLRTEPPGGTACPVRPKSSTTHQGCPWGRGVHGMGGGKMILEEVEGEKRSKETLAQE